ncbi:MAG TPA: hypothetical protein PK156_15405 [Polyangium sp.]|nr:hypothetical protein [Polyangium sp.]
MPSTPRPSRALDLWSAFVVLVVGLAFWIPGFQRTNGRFPIPLDDVYIHFAFARSAALGHPFEWSIGNGYSSGGTSLTYPLTLAPGWLVGFREDKLAWFAAIITCVCLWDVCRSVRLWLPRSSPFVRWFVPPILLSVPLADWSFYSGMETALFAAVLGRFVLATQRTFTVVASSRPLAQFHAGLWGVLLVATRPESAALVLPLGIAVAYGARALGTLTSLLRALGPMVVFLAGQATANYLLTSEAAQAGAVRKLIGTNPYLTPAEIAIEVLKNLIVLQTQALDAALGGRPWSLILFGLVVIGIFHRRTRLIALPLTLGAIGMLLLVSLNSTARYQNFRYAVPSILVLLFVATSTLGLLASKGKWGRALGFFASLVLVAAPARHFSKQIDHFARASANIEFQQATVGRRLAAQPTPPRRVFVGDAGAIPYLSGIAGLDGLGLGGYHDFPFARASVHGVPAVIELIERLPLEDRPDVMAIYPSWWPELALGFGKELFTVHIEDNVICAAPDKVVYSADWSTLESSPELRPNQIDEIDIADLVSEKAHHYAFSRPRAGWVIGTALTDARGRKRYDAGRIIPEGRTESFRLSSSVPRGPAELVLRSDVDARTRLRIEVVRSGQMVFQEERIIEARIGDSWNEPMIALPDVMGGDVIILTALVNAWRHHHSWLLR